MFGKKSYLAIACACVALGSPVAAAPPGATVATLLIAPPVAVHRVIDGRLWNCADMTCAVNASPGAESQPIGRECNRAARELGGFAAYQTGPRSLTAAELAKCNSGAGFLAKG